MERVFLGSTGVRVGRFAFGAMPFGGAADRAESERLFGRCRDAGIDLFDTADVYTGGASERILGELIAPCRDEVVLASKAYFPTGDGPNDRGSSRYHLVRAVDASLQRLGTDRIDLYYLHRFDDATPLDESLRALDDLVRAGKILYPAVSNFAAWQVAKAMGRCALHGLAPIAAIQPMYNLVKRQAESEILPFAQSEGLAVFPYSPLGGGLLSGKYGRSARPDTGRLVTNTLYATRYGDPEVFDFAERFTELARRHGHHPAALAVAWVGAHPGVTAPILGANSVAQLDDVLACADIDVTPELYAEIAALSRAPAPATDRSEESQGVSYGAR